MTSTKNIKNHKKDLEIILGGAGIAFLGKACQAIIQLAFSMLLARLYGPKITGLYFIGYAFFQVSKGLGCFALDHSARRYFPIVKDPIAFVSQLNKLLLATIIIKIK